MNHTLTMEEVEAKRVFHAACSCGWKAIASEEKDAHQAFDRHIDNAIKEDVQREINEGR